MHAPLYSTITLFAEIIISTVIYYTLYQGYKHNKFPVKLASAALLYEILFNITYMVSQVPNHARTARIEPAFVIALAIIHGILSLLMFLSLIVFFLAAWLAYRRKTNFFKNHSTLTMTFLIFWTLSVASGIVFYLMEYVF